jgi:hypothetical protein
MFGLMILVAVFAVLGFVLAWIIGIVAREEVSIGRGVVILLCTGVFNFLVNAGLMAVAPALAAWASLPVSFAVLTLMIHVIGDIEWKPSMIIAAVYSVIIFLVFLGLAAMVAATPTT